MSNEEKKPKAPKPADPTKSQIIVKLATAVHLPDGTALKQRFPAELDRDKGVISGTVLGKPFALSMHSTAILIWQLV